MMGDMKFNTEEEGLHTLFKPYQVILLEYLWKLNESKRVSVKSSEAYKHLLKHPEKKSRASVIFSLNDMVDDGILDFEDRTGKGGHHRAYFPKMSKDEFAVFAYNKITAKLKKAFPTK